MREGPPPGFLDAILASAERTAGQPSPPGSTEFVLAQMDWERYEEDLARFLKRHPWRRFTRWLAVRSGWTVGLLDRATTTRPKPA